MANKIFLFDGGIWLSCSEVSYLDGIWSGYVVNGHWHLEYNITDNHLKAYSGKRLVTESTSVLTWICDSDPSYIGYNDKISNAKERYENGELANFTIVSNNDITENEYDEVAF